MLTDPNATVEPICIMDPEIPDAELRIKLDPKYHNRIAMIKNTGITHSIKPITIAMAIIKPKMINCKVF